MEMISASASSSNSSVMSFKKYDVFLSFRGEDTRTTFTSHLYEALRQKVVTFIDYQLKKGDEISPAIIEAIKDSHVFVVILSENYASSKWCLEELSEILKCKKENQRQEVIPVFYNTDPSNVRKQTGSYKKAFAKHKRDHRCNKWKDALTEVANLAGWDSQGRTESELVKEIVRDVLTVLPKLSPRYPNQLEGLVGIEDECEQIESLLKSGPGDVRTIGIWGMGGIGKTTLAIALYAKLSHEFDKGSCFLANVREESEKHGLEDLRKKLFSKLLEEENHCFDAPLLVSDSVMRRLGRKKVLIVLDDVDTIKQLEFLIKGCDFLRSGSRIIVTTRNKHIFHQLVEVYYEVKELSSHHSLELFCLTAFGEKQPKLGYEDLSSSAISYCKGTPLALKVLGASLRGKSTQVWDNELRKFQQIPNPDIHNILKLSYDSLDRFQKNIFLDIACFFRGKARDMVTSLLDACGFFATSGIEVLLDKALVTISYRGTNSDLCIEMHDLIQEMGQKIVQESDEDPGRLSRLWKPEEVHDVLKDNRGTHVVEGIILDLDTLTDDLYLSSDSFARMTNLRLLIIHRGVLSKNRCKVYLRNGLESLSYNLRYLCWEEFCLPSLPSNFRAEQLVELCMPDSNLKKLWDGVQNLVNLKKIDLEDSRDLIEIPDLSKEENLEIFWLSGCESLRQLHPSMSSLPKLTNLSLSYCREIESINVHSKSLCSLALYDCPSLKELSVTSEEITELDLSNTSICALPASFCRNTKLTHLWLEGCNIIDELSDDSGMGSTTAPDHYGCTQHNASKLSSLQELLHNIDHFSSLEVLSLKETNVESLPANIKNLSLLKDLCLSNCRKLVSLPELPPSLKKVSACNCSCLETDFTQRLLLQHMLQSHIPYLNQQYLNGDYDDFSEFMFPGDHVSDECRFRTAGSSITIPYLPLSSHLCGFIYCIILSSKVTSKGGISCYIYQDGKRIDWDDRYLITGTNLISDHLLFVYVKTRHVFSDNLPWKLEFEFIDWLGGELQQGRIKECGIFPVYDLESGLTMFSSSSLEIFESESITQVSDIVPHPGGIGVGVIGSNNENELESITQIADNESQPTPRGIGVGVGVGGSDNQNENGWEQLSCDCIIGFLLKKLWRTFGGK